MPVSDPLSPARAEAILRGSPREIEAAVAELVAAGAEAVALLQRLEELAGRKQVRKLVRRGLHQLRSSGVPLEAPARKTGGGVLRPAEEAVEQGVVTPVDALGRRVVYLLVPLKGGACVYEVALSDIDGVLQARRMQGRRRDARSFVRSLRQQPGPRALFVPGSEVRALVQRALAVRPEAPPDHAAREVVAAIVAGAGEATPGERLRSQAGGSAAPGSPREVEALVAKRVEAGELLPWPVLAEPVRELARRLARVERSPIVLTDLQKRERRAELTKAAVPEIFAPEVRDRLAARLEETAVFLQDEGDLDGVRALLDLAARVRGSGAPLELDFLRRSLDLSLEIARRQLEEEQAGNLIVPE